MREIDIEKGFATISLISFDDEITYKIVACLKEKACCSDIKKRYNMLKNSESIYKREVDLSSMTWGVCSDINAPAYKKFGEELCISLLKRELRKIGVRVK